MRRVVQRELLDDLPPHDPAAVGSRRDLKRLNWLMDHPRLAARALLSQLGPGKVRRNGGPIRLVELGAGDGTFLLQVARHLNGAAAPIEAVLVDQQELVTSQLQSDFQAAGWEVKTTRADVFQFLNNGSAPADIYIANLFLHHFTDNQLRALFQLAQRSTQTFIALEPRRASLPLLLSRLVGCIGCGSVTRHDAPISVRAGFNSRELSELWADHRQWQVHERDSGLFTHVFVAQRLP